MAKNPVAEGLQSLCSALTGQKDRSECSFSGTRAKTLSRPKLSVFGLVRASGGSARRASENHRAAAKIEQLKHRLGEEQKYLEGTDRPEGSFSEIVGDGIAGSAVQRPKSSRSRLV